MAGDKKHLRGCYGIMITTTKGMMDETLLDKKEGFEENDEGTIHWIEYREKGEDEIIHRSVHIELKEGVELIPQVETL